MFRIQPGIYFSPDPPGGGADPPKDPPAPPEPTITEPTTEQLKNSLSASKRREKEASDKLTAVTSEVDTLKIQLEEIKSKELTDVEKLTQEKETLTKTNTDLKVKSESWDKHITAQTTAYEKAVEDLGDKVSDSVKDWLNDLPIEKRMAALQSVIGKPQNDLMPDGVTPRNQLNTKDQINAAETLEDIGKLKFG